MRTRVVGFALVAALTVGACGGASGTAPTGGSVPAASTGPTTVPASSSLAPVATPSASAPAEPSAVAGVLDLCPQEREPCPLPPGTYSPSRTTPKMTFTLGDGWTGFRHYEDAFGLGNQDGVAFSMARDVEVGFGGTPLEPGLAGFQAFLEAADVLEVQTVAPVTVGGMEGIQIDVVATGDAGGLYQVAKDQYNLSAGQKARFIVLDLEGTTVVFVFESADEASFPTAEAAVQPILESLTFE